MDKYVSNRYSSVADFDKSGVKSKSERKDIVSEVATIGGVQRTINRLYAVYDNGFQGVGWIVDDDIDNCMVCNSEFGFFLRKHHCRSCGNIVCYSCSPDSVVIEEMKNMGEQRVCVQCYWGQYPVYASHTRTWEEEEDSEDEADYIVASKINASINASVKSFHFQMHKYFEYHGDVVLEVNSEWSFICAALSRDLGLTDDLAATRGTTDVYHQSKPVMEFRFFVLVDADGDEMSPKLDTARLFWQFASRYSVIEKTIFLAYPAKGSGPLMEDARRGRKIRSESHKPPQDVENAPHSPARVVTPLSSPAATATSLPTNVDITRQRQDSDDSVVESEQHESMSKTSVSDTFTIVPSSVVTDGGSSRLLPDGNSDNDIEEEEDAEGYGDSGGVVATTNDDDDNDDDDNDDEEDGYGSGDNDVVIQDRSEMTPDVNAVNSEIAPYSPSATNALDEHRRTVEKLLADGNNSSSAGGGRSVRSASVIYPSPTAMSPSHYQLFRHSPTTTTPTTPQSHASTGMVIPSSSVGVVHSKRRKSTGGHTSLTREDIALLTLAKRSLRRSVTIEDRKLLKEAFGVDLEGTQNPLRSSSTEGISEEDSRTSQAVFSDAMAIVNSMACEISPVDGAAIAVENTTYDSSGGTTSEAPARPAKKYVLSKEDEELLYLARHSLSAAPVTMSSLGTISTSVGSVGAEGSEGGIVGGSCGNDDESTPSTSHTPFSLGLLPSFVSNSDNKSTVQSQPVVSPEEALRMLMSLETKKPPPMSTNAKGTNDRPTKKLSSADEALLQLARMSISHVASDNAELSSYIARESALFAGDIVDGNEDVSLDETMCDDGDDYGIGSGDDEYVSEAGDEDDGESSGVHGAPSMMSLKDIHRAALFEAFADVSGHVVVDGEVRPLRESDQDRFTEGDVSEEMRLLAREDFMNWEQIRNVLGEGILTTLMIANEFETIVFARAEHVKSMLGASDSRHSSEKEEKNDSLIDFEGFCDIMEKLEHLAEDMIAHIPADIKEAHASLSTDTGENSRGVCLDAVLNWSQLRSAIDAGLLSEDAVRDLFQSVVTKRSSTDNASLTPSSRYDINDTTELTLLEFSELSQLLQRAIDSAAGEDEAVLNAEYGDGSDQQNYGGVDGGALSPLEYDKHRPSRRRSSGAEHADDNSTWSNSERNVRFQQVDSEGIPIEQAGSNSTGGLKRPSRRGSTESVDTVDTYFMPGAGGFIDGDNDYGDDEDILNVAMTGFLCKQGSKVKSWKRRSFVLKGCRLSYYDGRKLKGEFSTKDCVVCELDPSEANGKENAFVITGPGRFLNLFADDEDERDRWIHGLTVRIEAHKQHMKVLALRESGAGAGAGADMGISNTGQVEDDNEASLQSTKVSDDMNEVGSGVLEEDEGIWEGEDRTLSTDAASLSVSLPATGRDDAKSIWNQFLDPNEILLCSGEVVKRNKYGIAQKRQLLLAVNSSSATVPRLFYVDASVMKVKGDVEWTTENPPKAELVNASTFKIVIDSRTFRLTTPTTTSGADKHGDHTNKSAEEWVTHINHAATIHQKKSQVAFDT